MKAYKLLDLETNKVFASWDVKFYEKIFPLFTGSSPTMESNDLFSPLVLPMPTTDLVSIDNSSSQTPTAILQTRSHRVVKKPS